MHHHPLPPAVHSYVRASVCKVRRAEAIVHHVWEENLMRYPCLSHHLHLQSRFDTQDPDLLPRALVQDIGARTTRTLETLQQRLEGVQHSVVVAFCVSKLWAMSSAQLPSVSNAPADSTSSWVLHRSRTPLSRDRRGDVLFERRFGSVLEESSGGRGGRIHAQTFGCSCYQKSPPAE